MNASQNKPFYKVISLFIKSVILFFSFYYIWKKLNDSPIVIDIPNLFSADNFFLTVALFILMFLNWTVEAYKWKLLIVPFESITLKASLKAIFSGVTISIFTPNRVGEFAGRVFFLKKANKIQASIVSLIGSFMQLFVTIIVGVLAYFVLKQKQFVFFYFEEFISKEFFLIYIGLLLVLICSVVFIYFKRETLFIRFKKYIEILRIYSWKELSVVFVVSFFRYLVFSVQYYLALKVFGINEGCLVSFSLIALTFFVTSAIPTFALTEIAVRVGVAIYFFGTISTDHSSIAAASLLLWLINLALPASIGSFFVWKLKIVKD